MDSLHAEVMEDLLGPARPHTNSQQDALADPLDDPTVAAALAEEVQPEESSPFDEDEEEEDEDDEEEEAEEEEEEEEEEVVEAAKEDAKSKKQEEEEFKAKFPGKPYQDTEKTRLRKSSKSQQQQQQFLRCMAVFGMLRCLFWYAFGTWSGADFVLVVLPRPPPPASDVTSIKPNLGR